MVESIEKLGDAFGVVWALFQHESGELTVLASVLLAGLALLTAFRCAQATLPAREGNFSNVLAVGGAISLIFTGVGGFFLLQAISGVLG